MHSGAHPKRNAVRAPQWLYVRLRVHVERCRLADRLDDPLSSVGQGANPERRGLPKGDQGLQGVRVAVGKEHQDGWDNIAEQCRRENGVRDGCGDGAADGSGIERARGGPDGEEEVKRGDDADALNLGD